MMTSPNLCHRCGNRLEEDAAFCPQCGAAQIRVAAPDPPPPEAAADFVAAAPAPGKIQWQRAFLATFLPAVGAILLLMVNPFFSYSFFVWIGVAGYLSVLFYRRRAPGALINPGIGARLGAAVGLFCFILQFILIAIGYVVERAAGHNMRAMLVDQMRKAASANPNPEAVKIVNQFLDRPDALVLLLVIVICVLFVSFLLAGLLGGTLGAAQSRNHPRP